MVGGQGAAWRVTRREGRGGLRPIIAHSTLDHCSRQPIGSKIRMEIQFMFQQWINGQQMVSC